MPLDPNKESTKIVISPIDTLLSLALQYGIDIAPFKELLAEAQSQKKFYRNIEDIPPGKCLALLAIQLAQPLTKTQYYEIFSDAQLLYGVEGIEVMYEGITPDYESDYQNDLNTTVNFVPGKREIEE